MGMKELPIGVQTFEDIVSGNYYYVDKTGMIHQLANKFRYVFLSRPRRFGKSLLSSTFHSYFAGERELFDGLEAGKLETEWVKHPVFHFDMSTAKHMNEEQLLGELDRKLDAYEQIYGRGEKDIRVNQRLEGLVQRSVERTGEKAVIIIDEYDAPLLDVMNDKQKLVPMRQIMRNFYSPIKSLDPYLRFVFITGINKFAQLSIFSELNNLKNISMLPEFSAVCGISQSELERVFPEQIEALAKAEGVSGERALELLKENYDGYHFCEFAEGVFNPFSVLNVFDGYKFSNYWFQTGTPTFLVELLKKSEYDLRTLIDGVEANASSFMEYRVDANNPIPLIYQSGYLTIKGYDKRFGNYLLKFPNDEVRYGFMDFLVPYYTSVVDDERGFYLGKFVRELESGDVDAFLTRLQAFFADFPYELNEKTERHYQVVFYLVFKLMGQFTGAEVRSARGRADAVVKTPKYIYVFEFKLNGTAEQALQQIDEKGYLIPYQVDGRELVKVGVEFSAEKRNIDRWLY